MTLVLVSLENKIRREFFFSPTKLATSQICILWLFSDFSTHAYSRPLEFFPLSPDSSDYMVIAIGLQIFCKLFPLKKVICERGVVLLDINTHKEAFVITTA